MVLPVSVELAVTVALVVGVAGAVNGVAGFGFAVVGTTVLASVLEPATAVAFMLVPMVAVNVALVGELTRRELRTCGARFGPLLVATVVGTVAGMAVLDRLPAAPLRVLLGVVSLGFVATAQRTVPLPPLPGPTDGRLAETTPVMAAVGLVSGVLFGATNVGVQLVAFVRSFDLSHGLFVGVVALVFLGINGVRVVAAGALGLYPDAAFALASVAAAVPAAAGVAVGRRLRDRVGERLRRGVVLGLLTVVGVRLLLGGVGVV
ncbi:TSUP family transporter [Halobaculum sp. MBLA0143]|uniref:TSUP family transporter n=1 Tax=Halobaculum sp. MBLA0143 TaxID=3079933 RepID=UPI003525DD88